MSRAIPMAIPSRDRARPAARRPGHDYSASVPNAPIIGSLPAPKIIENAIPDLDLPPSSPQAFSLALANSLPAPSRMAGVSSAPAISFMDQARSSAGSGSSVGYGTSPTVLSILQQKQQRTTGASSSSGSGSVSGISSTLRGLDLGAGTAASSGARPGSGGSSGIGDIFQKTTPAPSVGSTSAGEGGLASLLRGAQQSNSGSSGSNQIPGQSTASLSGGIGAALRGGSAAVSGGLPGSFGAGPSGSLLGGQAPSGRVVLSASFRDPSAGSFIPQSTILEDEGGDDSDNDDGVPSDLESSDDEYLGIAKGSRRRGGKGAEAGTAAAARRRSGMGGSGPIAEESGDSDSDAPHHAGTDEQGAPVRRGRTESLPGIGSPGGRGGVRRGGGGGGSGDDDDEDEGSGSRRKGTGGDDNDLLFGGGDL